MNKIKTAELTGAALDWAVLKTVGGGKGNFTRSFLIGHSIGQHNYSRDWAQGGPIIDRMMRDGLRLSGYACKPTDTTSCQAQIASIVTGGETPLIAAMRCYVASKLGDTVEVPAELLTN